MKIIIKSCIGLAAFVGLSSTAQANDTIRFELVAQVDPFCRISSTVSDDTPITVNGGLTSLGSVEEVCNTRNGYTIRAAFTNLSGGTVVAAGDQAQVNTLGMATFISSEARRQTRTWQLVDAQQPQEGSPVFMQLTISPTF